MFTVVLAVASMVLALPKEFHIDCSGWPGVAAAEIEFRFTPVTGKRIAAAFEMQPNTDPVDVRLSIERRVRDAGWRYDVVGKNILILKGSKDSPIQSVRFNPKGWTPDVRMVILAPK